jgi:hypothetical protein
MPTKLERQLEVFERAGEDLGLVYTGAERISADGSVEVHIPRQVDDLSTALLTVNVVGEASVGMVRRTALDVTGAFDESLPSCQDLDLWLRLCEQGRAEFVPQVLVRVWKWDDSVRISANVARTVWGREIFCQKHREQLVRHGVLHLYLRESGWWQQRRVGDARAARRCYRESLAANPVAPFTYVLLLAACLPMAWLDYVARCKHLLTRARRFARDATSAHRSRRFASTAKLERNASSDSATS